ncbi:MAG: helix-turn-helix domain-containing protein [Alistipes sp.]|nr:helix-turn-helix domain-containing protein [Alistipes sp.]
MSETNILDGKRLAAIYKQLDSLHTVIKKLKELNCKRLSNGNYLTDKELSNLLKVSRRCLQQYRSAGIIPYYQICGKVLYRESDIEELLMKSYKSAFGATKDSVNI